MHEARAARRCFHRLSRQPKYETVARRLRPVGGAVDNIFAVPRRAAEPHSPVRTDRGTAPPPAAGAELGEGQGKRGSRRLSTLVASTPRLGRFVYIDVWYSKSRESYYIYSTAYIFIGS